MDQKRIWSIFITFVLCFAFWMLLTMSVETTELLYGVMVCGVTAWFASGFFVQNQRSNTIMLNPVRWVMLLFYLLGVFGWELLKSNWAMAMAILKRKPVKQSIIRVPVHGLKDGYALALLSNCITMTPGTITVDLGSTEDENATCVLYVQWMFTETEDRDEAGEIIKGRMEKWIRRIWGE